MELTNEIHRLEGAVCGSPEGKAALREALDTLVLLLGPFTPHVCEEMWERLGHGGGGLVRAPWPAFDAAAAREDAVELAVQVNGKVRGRITVPRDSAEGAVRERALAEPRVAEHVHGRTIVKCVVVPGRLVSVVVK
jgi:leucyl-tRNA synthetase